MSSEVIKEPFVNCIGQTLNPGDAVVCVTTGYNTHVYTGVYRGVRKVKDYWGNHTKVCIEQIPCTRQKKVFCEDGAEEEFKWIVDPKTGWEKKATGRRYNWVDIPYRKSTLQLNRVFKVDTPLKEVSI